jgi:hypothetical protein
MENYNKIPRNELDEQDIKILDQCEVNLRMSIETDLLFQFENGFTCDNLHVRSKGFYESGTPYLTVDIEGSFVDPEGETQPISSVMEFWFDENSMVIDYDQIR